MAAIFPGPGRKSLIRRPLSKCGDRRVAQLTAKIKLGFRATQRRGPLLRDTNWNGYDLPHKGMTETLPALA
jgi:hypothetical protein